MKNKCPFCHRKIRTVLGLYWHFIFRHLTGEIDEEADQEPLPALPAKDPD